MNRSDILLMVILIGVVIFVASIFAHMAYGELSIIEGSNDSAAVMIDFESNWVALLTEAGTMDFFDSKVKHFKSGGFVIKNPEAGILIFGHPQGDQYKLFILTGDRSTYRIVADVATMNTPTITPQEPTETRAPKSSVGADITKWNDKIPTTTSRNVDREPSLTVTFDDPTLIFVNTEYSPQIQVKNELHKGVSSAINVIVERDGIILENINGETSSVGLYNPVITVSHPKYYQEFCYEVTVTATNGNLTSTTTHDFLAVTSVKYLDRGENEYGVFPERIQSDGDCNQ